MENASADYKATAMRVSRITMAGNLLLSLMKLLAGIAAHSAAMVSDAVHSASDVLSTIVVMIGIRIASRAPDKEHPYGHERLECLTSMGLAVMLAVVGLGIGKGGLESLMDREAIPQVPGIAALIAALVSIVSKEWMFRYTAKAAKAIQSTALMADAHHHRSDALSSIGALIGIAGARLGFPLLDPLAAVVICLFILQAAWEIFRDAMDRTIDHALPPEESKLLEKAILAVPGVAGIDSLKTRLFGARSYVDAEIAVDGTLSLNEAHEIAERVHDSIENDFPNVKHCMVHVNPDKAPRHRCKNA